MYFEIQMKLSNIPNQDVSIMLYDRKNKKVIEKIVLIEKNIIKFNDTREGVKKLKQFSDKFVLLWEIKDSLRNGII